MSRLAKWRSYLAWGAAAIFVVLLQADALAQEATAPIKQMDGGTRAKVLATMAGLIILGFALVLLTWLGARVTQRYRRGSSVFQPTRRPGEHDWARKPLDGTPEKPKDKS